jgi:hypothetical protein
VLDNDISRPVKNSNAICLSIKVELQKNLVDCGPLATALVDWFLEDPIGAKNMFCTMPKHWPEHIKQIDADQQRKKIRGVFNYVKELQEKQKQEKYQQEQSNINTNQILTTTTSSSSSSSSSS